VRIEEEEAKIERSFFPPPPPLILSPLQIPVLPATILFPPPKMCSMILCHHHLESPPGNHAPFV